MKNINELVNMVEEAKAAWAYDFAEWMFGKRTTEVVEQLDKSEEAYAAAKERFQEETGVAYDEYLQKA